MNRSMHNNRGVALLIVLLVTALLIALIFEFAYATRVSMRSAVNFRDSQRAYYLARSGVNFVGRVLADNLKNGKKQDNLAQTEWLTVPVVSGEDLELRVRWEDEAGKINIKTMSDVNVVGWLEKLFENRQISADVLDKMKEQKTFLLNTELHRIMSDEYFGKVESFVTVFSDQKIDVNTASEEVLNSLGIEPSLILSKRESAPITELKDISGLEYVMTKGNLNIKNFLDVTSNVFKVYSYATAGEYLRQVEAVIKRDASGFSVLYWRAL